MKPVWCVMPVLAGPEMTEAAIADCLAQSVPTRVLVINQGIDDAFREHLERLSEADDRIFVWSHEPPLLSLAASWNRALDFVWEAGGDLALVVNNDVRLHDRTIQLLREAIGRARALFVTAVGVTAEQFAEVQKPGAQVGDLSQHGGPDFSCFLISRDCHMRYRFDEAFVPAFCEDLDYHRRLMLAGDGARIFSVNVPYLHLASATLKTVDPQRRMAIERQIEQGSRAYYAKKWGGPVNQETFQVPFGTDGFTFTDGSKTTPTLQRVLAGPPIEELCKRMLSLADVGVTPQPPRSSEELAEIASLGPDDEVPF